MEFRDRVKTQRGGGPAEREGAEAVGKDTWVGLVRGTGKHKRENVEIEGELMKVEIGRE